MKNHYNFPIIRNISEVLPAIKDRKEFIVAEREGFTIINYVVAMEDTFPPVTSEAEAILRECRGLVFDSKTGDVMSRRYHKFFNVGEREESSPQFVDLSKPHVILEKLDGSMITPLVSEGKIRWGTKMGLTDVGALAEEFVATRPEYEEFAAYCLSMCITPIFEFCSRRAKIVVDYAEEQLILTAIRNNNRGQYLSYNYMVKIAAEMGIPVVKAYDGLVGNDIRRLMQDTALMKDVEGFIVRFDDGHMVKIKGEWYLQLHRAKDVTKYEKNVLEIILEDKLDDLLPLLEPEYQEIVKKYRDNVYTGIREVADDLEYQYANIIKVMRSKEKREFAIHWVKIEQNKKIHSFLFGRWDNKSMYDQLKAELLKACSSINRLENNRWMMDGATYELTNKEKE